MKKISAVLVAGICGVAIFGGAACGQEKGNAYTVYAPDGAPALSLCYAMTQSEADGGTFDYHIVDSSAIKTFVTGRAPVADFAVLPVNLASILDFGEEYQMLGTVTNGCMYFLTVGGEALTRENLSTLVGKTVGVVQLNNVPGLTLQAVLQANSLTYSIVGDDGAISEDAINLKAVDAKTGVTPAGGCDYYLCPEPAASAKVKGTQGKLKMAGDLQELYGEGGYPQAVLVAKKSVIEGDVSAVQKLVSYLEESKEYLKTAQASAIVSALSDKYPADYTPTFSEENLNSEVLENCSVWFTKSAICKENVNTFLKKLIAANANSQMPVAKVMPDSFFYMG